MDIQEINRTVIEEFRANGGKVEGQFAGAPLLLLNTIGAKSGLPRTNPLAYVADGDRFVVVASYAGGLLSVLPPEQEAHEGRCRHGFDLLAQPGDGVAVNSRQNPAVAEFFIVSPRSKAPATRPSL